MSQLNRVSTIAGVCGEYTVTFEANGLVSMVGSCSFRRLVLSKPGKAVVDRSAVYMHSIAVPSSFRKVLYNRSCRKEAL